MKKRKNVSPTDYEWLKYNALVEISDKLSLILKALNGTEYQESIEPQQLCPKCKNNMVWAILANRWICIECGHVITIQDMIKA